MTCCVSSVSLLATQHWAFPVPITYGPGTLSRIARACRASGMRRPLVVTDQGSQDLPFVQEALKLLKLDDISADLFSEVSPNPRDSEIRAGRTRFKEGNHDGVVAIGGGSGLDAGKAICLIANNDIELLDFDFNKPSPTVREPFPPLICVPSTAGTGAETDSTAMITDTVREMKICVWHPGLKPSLAILDPRITLSMPAHLTAWTGCDALIHALEAFCVPTFHPLCDGIALEALRLIGRYLERTYRHPDDLEARGGMLVGSCLAGVSFQKGLGLVHAISHMVGAEFDTHHGLTNAIVLPTVLRFNAEAIAEKLPSIAEAVGCKGVGMEAFFDHTCELLDRLAIPRCLADIGVSADQTASIAAKAMQDLATSTNPRKISLDEMRTLVEEAILRGR